jgi:hypothetical protein
VIRSSQTTDSPKVYSVSDSKKKPLLDFIVDALIRCGCSIVYRPSSNIAPYRVIFDTKDGSRMGIIAYAFFANSKVTRNRPGDEYRFQVKYGKKDGHLHSLWQDPYGLYTTLFLGIDPETKLFIGADPVLHSPTKFFVSIEFKNANVADIQKNHWSSWERAKRPGDGIAIDRPVEVLVGGKPETFLKYIKFEREALGEDQGHRQLLAEQAFSGTLPVMSSGLLMPSEQRLHELAREFELGSDEILDLISHARRLKMAVRGWVAEKHLERVLKRVPDVTECHRVDDEGFPDISLRYRDRGPITVECKNVLRERASDGTPRVDFQRTRAAIGDPCSRYYRSSDFDMVAACLHAVTQRWEFRFSRAVDLQKHKKCEGRLASNVRVDGSWVDVNTIAGVLEAATLRSGCKL